MTLLEVIVAMTLLAVGIVSLLAAVSSCVRTSDSAAQYSRAALLAQQVTAEFERRDTLAPGDFSGTFDESAVGFAWTATVAAANAAGLYPLRVTVSWGGGGRNYLLTTALRPHALPPAATPPAASAPAADAATPPGAPPPANTGTPAAPATRRGPRHG